MPTTAIRILIADAQPISCEGLRRLVRSQPDFQVVGEAGDTSEVLGLLNSLNPDVLLLDSSLGRLSVMGTLKVLGLPARRVRVIILAAQGSHDQMLEALQLGAHGIVHKKSPTDVLFKAIRCVMRGEYWINKEAVSEIMQVFRDRARTQRHKIHRFGLSEREMQIIAAVVAGDTNKEMASRFEISAETVKHHLTSIYAKLGLATRLELALFAIDRGLATRGVAGRENSQTAAR